MNKEHLKFLLNAPFNQQGAVGRNVADFANAVLPPNLMDNLPNHALDRAKLFEFCAKKNNSNLAVTMAVIAWGVMRYDHARFLLANWNNLNPIIQRLRNNEIANRQEAFLIFWEAKNRKMFTHMGISYYTKLIYFIQPKLNGYILDQWTAKSINLLYDDKLVRLSSGGSVEDTNTQEVYEQYCNRIEELAEHLNCTPSRRTYFFCGKE